MENKARVMANLLAKLRAELSTCPTKVRKVLSAVQCKASTALCRFTGAINEYAPRGRDAAPRRRQVCAPRKDLAG